MPLGEIILTTILETASYLIFELFFKGLSKAYYGVRKLVFGKDRPIPDIKRIEKLYLFKKFKLKSDLMGIAPKGTSGTIKKVVDEGNLLVELEDLNARPIRIKDKQTFKIELDKVLLERKRGTLRRR